MMTVVAFLFTLYYIKTEKQEALISLARLTMVILAMVLIWVAIGYADKEGNFKIYYPYRQCALGALFSYILIIHYTSKYIFAKISPLKTSLVLLLLAIPILSYRMIVNVKSYFNVTRDFDALCEYAQAHSEARYVFAFLGFGWEEEWLSFMRKAERDPYFSNKLCPIEKWRMQEWYERKLAQQAIHKNPEAVLSMHLTYPHSYIVSKGDQVYLNEWLVYKSGIYYLYKLPLCDTENH